MASGKVLTPSGLMGIPVKFNAGGWGEFACHQRSTLQIPYNF